LALIIRFSILVILKEQMTHTGFCAKDSLHKKILLTKCLENPLCQIKIKVVHYTFVFLEI
jgi:hypothetical protein